uniref:Cupin 2 conserved barrel domain protein n=1 Tax=uncultured organism TaxID=155900 RepID=M1QBQ1_9ZZZZ|nr:cupin 2 conserved barrel domain protein [uncultured organism]
MGNEENLLKEISNEIFKIEELIDYQTNSVVSKTLVDRKTGTLTLFAFDKGQTLSEHTAPYDALVQILEGKSKIKISGENLVLESGESTVIPENATHSLKAVKRFKMLLTMIK